MKPHNRLGRPVHHRIPTEQRLLHDNAQQGEVAPCQQRQQPSHQGLACGGYGRLAHARGALPNDRRAACQYHQQAKQPQGNRQCGEVQGRAQGIGQAQRERGQEAAQEVTEPNHQIAPPGHVARQHWSRAGSAHQPGQEQGHQQARQRDRRFRHGACSPTAGAAGTRLSSPILNSLPSGWLCSRVAGTGAPPPQRSRERPA